MDELVPPPPDLGKLLSMMPVNETMRISLRV
jgi:hypothetical protein